jgi:PAS domain S-box-containing protein
VARSFGIPTSTSFARGGDGPSGAWELQRWSSRGPSRPRLEYPDTEARYPGGARASNDQRVGTLVADLTGNVRSCGLTLPGRFPPAPAAVTGTALQRWLPGVTVERLAAECGVCLDEPGLARDDALPAAAGVAVIQRLLEVTRRDWSLPPSAPPARRLRIAANRFLPVDTACRMLALHGVWHLVVDLWLRDRAAQSALDAWVARAEGAASIVMITDRSGTIHYANPALEAATGWPRHELAGRNAASLRRHAEDAAHAAWTALRAGRAWQGAFSLWGPDGDVLPQKVRVRPFSMHGGPVTHFICVGRTQQPATRHRVLIP